jgi:hypothetical protein
MGTLGWRCLHITILLPHVPFSLPGNMLFICMYFQLYYSLLVLPLPMEYTRESSFTRNRIGVVYTKHPGP